MGVRLRVFLQREEERTLRDMRQAESIGRRERDRATAICLSHYGWYVEKIASYLEISIKTVRKILTKWEKEGLGGIYEKKGRGRAKKWHEEDMAYLEKKLRNEQRRYNSQQLSEVLARERGVTLSSDRLRRVLKKRG